MAADVWELARSILTVKQYDALRLWTSGLGYDAVALSLGVGKSTARQRIVQSLHKLRRALREREEREANGEH